MYLKNYHVIAEMYLLYLLLGQLSRVDVNIYIYREARSPPFNSVILFLFPVLILKMKEEIDRTDPND